VRQPRDRVPTRGPRAHGICRAAHTGDYIRRVSEHSSTSPQVDDTPGRAAGSVLAVLAAAQFVMTLDSSVMNVSIVTVAEDVGSDITGIQTAITAYTLVMASLMITGGKVGQILGPRRAFMIGGVIYGLGSITTAASQNLTMLLVGWSLLEGVGAALILPAIVALVASNVAPADRPRAYGLVTASAAIAVAAGPLIGGAFTTYLSWRWVFVGEVLVLTVVLVAGRSMASPPPDCTVAIDRLGTVLSAAGLAAFVFGVLRAGVWGLVTPTPDAPVLLGVSAAFWLMLGGGLLLWVFLLWEQHLADRGGEPLVDPEMLANPRLRVALTVFFFQFLLQAGMFYLISLYLTVALGLSAVDTGVRLMPLSITLIAGAVGVPRFAPHTSPRRVIRLGLVSLVGALALLIALLGQYGDEAWVVTVPLLLAGFGIGALASQLGNVAVASVPTSRSGEVGGLQNTATNLGASIATALSGAVLVAGLTAAFITGIRDDPAVPDSVVAAAEVQLASGAPFVSDQQLSAGLTAAELDPAVAAAIVSSNADARVRALQAALGVLTLLGLVAFVPTRRLPTEQPGDPDADDPDADDPDSGGAGVGDGPDGSEQPAPV
jgi:MFS family permease